MALVLITAPAVEPVSTAEAKAHLRVTASDEDTLIASLVKSARAAAELKTSRALISQTWEMVLDGFPSAGIRVPLPPLASVTSITYVDTAGVTQTLAPLSYAVDTDSTPGWIVPAYGFSWPQTRSELNAVRIRFVAGWPDAASVPEEIKTWIKMRVATLYENREAIVVGQTAVEAPRDFVDGLLDGWRVLVF